MATATKARKTVERRAGEIVDYDPIPVGTRGTNFREELVTAVENPGKWYRVMGNGSPTTKKPQEQVDKLNARAIEIPNPDDEWVFMVGNDPNIPGKKFVFAKYLGEQGEDDA